MGTNQETSWRWRRFESTATSGQWGAWTYTTDVPLMGRAHTEVEEFKNGAWVRVPCVLCARRKAAEAAA